MYATTLVYLIIGLLGASSAALVVFAILDSRAETVEAPQATPAPAFWSQLLGYRQRRRAAPQRAARQLNPAASQAKLA